MGLKQYLFNLGFITIVDVGLNCSNSTGLEIWLFAKDIGLDGVWAKEWNYYIKNLKLVGIVLSYEDDKLIWSWNTRKGEPIAKLVYDSLFLEIFRKNGGHISCEKVKVHSRFDWSLGWCCTIKN